MVFSVLYRLRGQIGGFRPFSTASAGRRASLSLPGVQTAGLLSGHPSGTQKQSLLPNELCGWDDRVSRKAFRKRGGSCAPRAIPGVGQGKQKSARCARCALEDRPRSGRSTQPIRHPAGVKALEILSEKCSIPNADKNRWIAAGFLRANGAAS